MSQPAPSPSRARRPLISPAITDRAFSPAGVLIACLAVNLFFVVYFLTFAFHGEAFSDTGIYRQWAAAGFDESRLQGLPTPWVYPILALVPIAIAGAFGPGPFLGIWVLMIAALNCLAVGFLTNWGRSRDGARAAWWWLLFVLIMGTLGFTRVDGFTAPVVLIALVFGVGRPALASAILSVATWMKIWPAAVLLALFTAVRSRVRVVLAAVAVTAGVGIAALALGVAPRLLNFLTAQGDRGMQLEATFTTPWLWLSVLHVDGARMYMNTEINSMQVDGPGTAVASFLMQPLFVLAALTVVGLLFWALHRGKQRGVDRSELLLVGALTMVTAFVVFNKVGSPQFMVWLAPAVAVGLAHSWRQWKVPAALLIAIAAATYVVYPLYYDALSHNDPGMALVLTIRNALLVVLFVWSVRRLYLLGRGAGTAPEPTAGDTAASGSYRPAPGN
ncbi:DUF2029 domain-containing protein [Paenarthrobacter sp. DKR-5]|uniref:glycosyltransferase 87 family protein n=1 Tax=Paenarthrobacter sp. DKR-5 TaxID=2835535 RepID=UPI001BDC21B5|nr:DUF2029 domain-containing protein [Paenarthrobacter sp. DKR-5]